jgi:hypothetical protein
MMRASDLGARLFRNNQGIARYTKNGRVHTVQYGLANPGGSDLIGYIPVRITPDMVGQTFARFVAIEVKSPKGRPTIAQNRFLQAVADAGGASGILRYVHELEPILGLPSTNEGDDGDSDI